MIGTKFYKNNLNDEEYAACANWCNDNNATIEDKGDFFECVLIPAPTIDVLKSEKILELKKIRDLKELFPVDYRGYLWDFDDKAQQRINGAIIALSGGGSVTWTSANNEEIANVNAQDLRGVVGAAALRSNNLHIQYRQLRERVEACKNADELNGVIWK